MTEMGEGTFGEGTYGDVLPTIQVRVSGKTSTTVNVSWDAVSGAEGFIYYKNGHEVARTYKGTTTGTRFAYLPGDVIAVAAIKVNPQPIATGQVKV